jgi:cytidylate kinase
MCDGVILGRGAHLILANAGALRVRLTGSEAVCAARIAAAEGLDPAAARQRVHDSNHRREQFVRETFGQGLGDANSFDLTLCTDHFADPDGIVDLLLRAFDQLTPPVVA